MLKEHFALWKMYAANLQELKMVWPGYYSEVGRRNHFSRQLKRSKEKEKRKNKEEKKRKGNGETERRHERSRSQTSSCRQCTLAKAPDSVK